MNIEFIGLSLSSKCSGKCLYCPDDRGCELLIKHMDVEIAVEVLSNLKKEDLKPKINFGENGDCFLNKDWLEIFRLFKDYDCCVYTNFSLLNEEKAEIIINEKLVNSISFNFDGFNEHIYRKMKGLNIEVFKRNIENFVRLRERYNSKIKLHGMIITMKRYIESLIKIFGILPKGFDDYKCSDIVLFDDKDPCEEYLKSVLKPGLDCYEFPLINAWAERKKIQHLKGTNLICPYKKRIGKHIYVSTNGDIYGCCLDHNNRYSFGNIMKKSLSEIYNGEKAQSFFNNIEADNYDAIGFPCSDRLSCQLIG